MGGSSGGGGGGSGGAVRSRNLASTTSLPLNHSLQVGSHLPLQHRNSFCVSALSQPAPLYPHGVDGVNGVNGVNYSSLSTIDPYLIYADIQHPKLDRLPSQVLLFPHPPKSSKPFSPSVCIGRITTR